MSGESFCNRFEEEGLKLAERGEPLDEHYRTCPDCQVAQRKILKIVTSIPDIKLSVRPRFGWEAEVLAETRRQARHQRGAVLQVAGSGVKAHRGPGASDASFAPGVMIAGKYRITRLLGEGAMGSVWAAMNESTQREVALKLIVRPVRQFRHLTRALGALRHRNIIDVHDIGETDTGATFLVMQLLTGETVAELLARERRVDPSTAARIGRDVASALAAAHAASIIHRDLKPANIFLHTEPDDPQPLVKVLDFGVAKSLAVFDGLHTAVGGAVGSHHCYMSPEQVRAQPDVDHRADIWTLGVILFEMLTGVHPFDGDTQRVFAGILAGEISIVERRLSCIDRNLSKIVARCMRRNREKRFQFASEVATLLDRFAQEPATISGIFGAPALSEMPEHAVDLAATMPLSPHVERELCAEQQAQPVTTALLQSQPVAPTVATAPLQVQPVVADRANARGPGPLVPEPQAYGTVRVGSSPGAQGGGPRAGRGPAPGNTTLAPKVPGASSTTPLEANARDATVHCGRLPSGASTFAGEAPRHRKQHAVIIGGVALGLCVAGASMLIMMRGGESGAPQETARPAPMIEEGKAGGAADAGSTSDAGVALTGAAVKPEPGLIQREFPNDSSSPTPTDQPRAPAKPVDPCAGMTGFLLTNCRRKHPEPEPDNGLIQEEAPEASPPRPTRQPRAMDTIWDDSLRP